MSNYEEAVKLYCNTISDIYHNMGGMSVRQSEAYMLLLHEHLSRMIAITTSDDPSVTHIRDRVVIALDKAKVPVAPPWIIKRGTSNE